MNADEKVGWTCTVFSDISSGTAVEHWSCPERCRNFVHNFPCEGDSLDEKCLHGDIPSVSAIV